MLTLESYLSGDIQHDREDIAAIDRVLAETAATIGVTFDREKKSWPYQISDGERGHGADSLSTMTMMIRAIDLLRETKGGRQRASCISV